MVSPLEVNVVPSHRGGLFDDSYSMGVSMVFEAGQQLTEYPGVEIDDGIGD
jgi:hypothetical protein